MMMDHVTRKVHKRREYLARSEEALRVLVTLLRRPLLKRPATRPPTQPMDMEEEVALAIIACAVVVACALVASSDLQGKRFALYGIGSGEETEANNAADVAFGTFAGSEANEEIVTEAGANYKKTFEEIDKSAEFAETLEEVEAAIDQGTEEGALLAHYYAGNDSPP